MIRHGANGSRIVACILVFLLATAVSPASPEATTVSISGRIFQPDGMTPYPGVTVRVTLQETGEVFTSSATNAAGEYEFIDLPAGTYSFEVEVDKGVYRLDRSVRIGEAEEATISFTVKPDDDDGSGAVPPGEGEGMSKKKKLGTLFAIIGGGALLIVAADDGGSSGGSPFQP